MFHYYYDTPNFAYSPVTHRQLQRQALREREYERRARALAAQRQRQEKEEYAMYMLRRRRIQEEYARKKLEEAEFRRRSIDKQRQAKEALLYGRDGRLYRYAHYPEFYDDESVTEAKERQQLENLNKCCKSDDKLVKIAVQSGLSNNIGSKKCRSTAANNNTPVAKQEKEAPTNTVSIPVKSYAVEVEYASDDEHESLSRTSLTPSEVQGESWLEPVVSYVGPQ